VASLNGFGAADIPVAAVATGFPSGQYGLTTRLDEIKAAVAAGATEIDIVINRTLALNQKWTELYEEVSYPILTPKKTFL
jgi:deoxyribose-phosphate aldolase